MKPTFWERVYWKLFGETNAIYTIAIGAWIIAIAFWSTAGYVIYHFITKYW